MKAIHELRLWAVSSWRRLRKRIRKHQSLGSRGERHVVRYLRGKGYHIIEMQMRNLYGEIDIIAVDQRTIVFVEVKTRSSHDAGHPTESVTEDKQKRLTNIALAYLRHHDLLAHAARFDVAAVTWNSGRSRPLVEYYEAAFEANDQFQMFS